MGPHMHIKPTKTAALSLCLLLLAQVAPAHAQAQTIEFKTPYVTRAEAAMILLKTRMRADVPLVTDKTYNDVQPGSWYERFVVQAAHMGIMEPSSGTMKLRPDDVVLRAEFLKMTARTFGFQENLPYLYRDVSANAWYAAFAGIADRYNMFSSDTDQETLKPDSVLSHVEVARALQSIVKMIDTASLPPLTEKKQATEQTQYGLTVYGKISTQNDQVILVKPPSKVVLRIAELPEPPPPAYTDESKIPGLRKTVIALVNLERQKAGLNKLITNTALEQSAQRYADTMADRGFFGHVSPEGEILRMRIEASGYYKSFYSEDCMCVTRYTVGENIARGQKTPQEVVQAWMRSPSHRETILTPVYTDIGIGINSGVFVQHFGGQEEKSLGL